MSHVLLAVIWPETESVIFYVSSYGFFKTQSIKVTVVIYCYRLLKRCCHVFSRFTFSASCC